VKTLRVFISSTFRDMHAERDHLVRVVFPELKERCRARRVHLIDVDLRWGVTEVDAEQGKVLDICLDEIDSCRPFFLGILGHRYGWVPPGHTHSITAQEICHGVLHGNVPRQVVDLRRILDEELEGRTLSIQEKECLARCYTWDPDRRRYFLEEEPAGDDAELIRSVFQRYSSYQKDRSFFFFRSESLTRRLASGRTSDFFEQRAEAQQSLAALKQEIVDSSVSHVEYDDIDAFGRLVLNALWTRIEADVEQAPPAVADWLTEEAALHELFMADRTRRFVGRRTLLDRIHQFCRRDDDPPLLVVTGEPGCGKSALTARLTEEVTQTHPDWLVLSHFVGASPASASLRQTLYRFCRRLTLALGSSAESPQDLKELLRLFPELLAAAAAQRKVLIIIDAVNQLEKTDNALSMCWVPPRVPANVRFVLSTLAGEAQRALLARAVTPETTYVPGLLPLEVRALVRAFLREIRHEFPNRAVEEAFFARVTAGNPLYIMVALEELRVFGRFELLEERIRRLPDNVPDLFEQVLERLEGDFDPALVRDWMAFLACGRHGMTAEELQTLLRRHAPRLDRTFEPVRLPALLWSRLYRSCSAYLLDRSGVIDFFHGQLKEAVRKRYLQDERFRTSVHTTIADYFEARWRDPYVRALSELPHQLRKAALWPRLEARLTSYDFLSSRCAQGLVYESDEDYRLSLSELPDASATSVPQWYTFLRERLDLLAAGDGDWPADRILLQLAVEHADRSPVTQGAETWLAGGLCKWLWMRKRLRPRDIPDSPLKASLVIGDPIFDLAVDEEGRSAVVAAGAYDPRKAPLRGAGGTDANRVVFVDLASCRITGEHETEQEPDESELRALLGSSPALKVQGFRHDLDRPDLEQPVRRALGFSAGIAPWPEPVVLLKDGTTLVTGTCDGIVRVWRLDRLRDVLEPEEDDVARDALRDAWDRWDLGGDLAGIDREFGHEQARRLHGGTEAHWSPCSWYPMNRGLERVELRLASPQRVNLVLRSDNRILASWFSLTPFVHPSYDDECVSTEDMVIAVRTPDGLAMKAELHARLLIRPFAGSRPTTFEALDATAE
jgi:hypothetical protein